MFRSRKAKIVATIGPSSASPDVLRKLFAAGVDVFRLNFSHGIHADHEAVFHAIRAIEQEAGRPIGILQDLQCPKIRVGTIRDGKQAVALNEKLRFVPGMAEGGKDAIPLPHPEVFEAVMPGHELLIDDGRLRLRIEGFEGDAIVARAMNAGVISNRNGVNLPSTVLNLSPLTAKDLSDVEFGLKLGVDFVALSFVQKPSDMIEAQGLVQGCAHLVAKIEKPSALEQIEDIVRLSDAVMIARGDLGVEIPPEDVPRWQKNLCVCAG